MSSIIAAPTISDVAKNTIHLFIQFGSLDKGTYTHLDTKIFVPAICSNSLWKMNIPKALMPQTLFVGLLLKLGQKLALGLG